MKKALPPLITLGLLILIGVLIWNILFPAVHRAARSGNVDRIRILLDENPALVNDKNFQGATALHFAAREGHVEAVKLLLSRGANIDEQDGSGQTALHWATTAGHRDVVEVLIVHGADVNIKSSFSGWAPLHLAAKLGRKEIAELLIAKGADPNLKDKHGAPPVNYVANDELRSVFERAKVGQVTEKGND